MTQVSSDGLHAIVEVLADDNVAGWVEVPPGAAPPAVELFVDDLQVDATFAVDAGERHSLADVRVFRFPLADLWQFVGPANRLSVRVAGRPLPMAGHGMFSVPDRAGGRTTEELRRRLAAGEVFSR